MPPLLVSLPAFRLWRVMLDHAGGMTRKLDALDSEFRTHRHALVDLVDDEETLLKEQSMLDDHDDLVAELGVRIQQLISICTSSSVTSSHKIAARRLSYSQKNLSSISTAVASLSGGPDDTCLLLQYEDQLGDCKKELADIRNSLLSLGLEETDSLSTLLVSLEKELFGCSLKMKQLLHASSHSHDLPTVPLDGKGVKLPKIDVPTFDGNILHWRSFWEQFRVSIHDRSNLSDSEKLVYLQHSLKGGSARNVIEGLSRSGEYYAEAVECLQSRYDRPCLIHQMHVRTILEAPALKDGSGKELRHLHDTVQQHLRALKVMEYEPSGPFITSVLKLDVNTMFEWQKHSQDTTDVPHYTKLLEFINLRAQASEATVSGHKGPQRSESQYTKRNPPSSKPVESFTASAADSTTNCVLCKTDKHPLYACMRFKSLPHDKMMSTLKTNGLCVNCLRPDHFVKQCKSLHRCRRCQKPHHTLLHIENEKGSHTAPSSLDSAAKPVTSNTAAGLTTNILLMTCRVLVDAPDGSSLEARALLDSASSASFVSERIAQTLSRAHQTTRISRVAGLSHNPPLQSIANFKIASTRAPGKKMEVTAVVVPCVTCDLPLHSVSFDPTWNNLTDIPLADPEFGCPGRVDILFIETLLHGWRIGPPGSPIALETKFGWVLAGRLDSCDSGHHIASHHAAALPLETTCCVTSEIEENPKGEMALSPEMAYGI